LILTADGKSVDRSKITDFRVTGFSFRRKKFYVSRRLTVLAKVYGFTFSAKSLRFTFHAQSFTISTKSAGLRFTSFTTFWPIHAILRFTLFPPLLNFPHNTDSRRFRQSQPNFSQVQQILADCGFSRFTDSRVSRLSSADCQVSAQVRFADLAIHAKISISAKKRIAKFPPKFSGSKFTPSSIQHFQPNF
jgi:hypothetical protein